MKTFLVHIPGAGASCMCGQRAAPEEQTDEETPLGRAGNGAASSALASPLGQGKPDIHNPCHVLGDPQLTHLRA